MPAPAAKPRVLTLRRVVVTALFAAAIIGGALLGVFLAFESDLPQVTSLEEFQPNIITQVFASDGSVIGEFAIEKRVVVAVPRHPAGAAQRDRRRGGRRLLEAHRDQPLARARRGGRQPALRPLQPGLLDAHHAALAAPVPDPGEDPRSARSRRSSSPSRSRRTSRRRRSSPSTATRSTSATATTASRRRAASCSASR